MVNINKIHLNCVSLYCDSVQLLLLYKFLLFRTKIIAYFTSTCWPWHDHKTPKRRPSFLSSKLIGLKQTTVDKPRCLFVRTRKIPPCHEISTKTTPASRPADDVDQQIKLYSSRWCVWRRKVYLDELDPLEIGVMTQSFQEPDNPWSRR